mmetsp:Transcript_6067/g.14602  ORF Transcript_6067/g.14602 Transcript_6067/m.14602 type:complete len:291 (+) Transcript_6067:158-1030(+)
MPPSSGTIASCLASSVPIPAASSQRHWRQYIAPRLFPTLPPAAVPSAPCCFALSLFCTSVHRRCMSTHALPRELPRARHPRPLLGILAPFASIPFLLRLGVPLGRDVEGLNHVVVVGVDARVARNLHRPPRYLLGTQVRHVLQSKRRALRVDPPAPDPAHAVAVLQDVPVAREGQGHVLVRHHQHRVEHPAQVLVAPPLLGELHRRTQQLRVLLQLGLELLEEGDGVDGGARESRDDLAVEKGSYLLRIVLDHKAPLRHLSVADDDDLAVLAHREDRGCIHPVGILLRLM